MQRLADEGGLRGGVCATAPATFRAYGGMVKAAVREWVDREAPPSQNQVRDLLSETLIVLSER